MRIHGLVALSSGGAYLLGDSPPWMTCPDYLRMVRERTAGGVIVMGSRTFDHTFDEAPVWEDCMMLRMGGEVTSIYDRGGCVGYWQPGVWRIVEKLRDRPLNVWVLGGSSVHRCWLSLMDELFEVVK